MNFFGLIIAIIFKKNKKNNGCKQNKKRVFY